MKNILIACEFSGIVRDAFIARGHNAWSCDLLPSEGRQANHLTGDVRHAIDGNLFRFSHAVDCRTGRQPVLLKWDLMIAHPPCTHLAVSGARWFKDKREEQEAALLWWRRCLTRQFHALHWKTQSQSFRRESGNQIKSSSLGNSATARPKRHVFGLRICQSSCRPTSLTVVRRAFTSLRPVRIAGKSAVGLCSASLRRWRRNGRIS